MIRVISKKNIAFRNPANRDEQITVRPFEFATLPDWAEKDPMFGWAVKDGVLEVSKETIVAAKEEPKKEVKPEPKPAKKTAKKTVKKPVKKE